MNQIRSLKDISEAIARRYGIDAAECEDTIKIWVADVTKALAENGFYDAPHIGQLSVIEGNIEFTPSESMANAVNAPFSMFEPTELAEGFNPENVSDNTGTKPEQEGTGTEAPRLVEPEKPQEQVEDAVPVDTPLSENAKNDEPIPHTTVPVDEAIPETEIVIEDKEPDEIKSVDTPCKRPGMPALLVYIYGVLTGLVIACVAVYFLYPPLHISDEEYLEYQDDDSTPEPAITENDKTEAIDTVYSEPVVTEDKTVMTDTVSTTRFLATMSRQYYGRMEFWAYIYLENKDKLGHPDRIAPGTVVAIPPASKYHIDANSKASVDSAQALIQQIYAPYK